MSQQTSNIHASTPAKHQHTLEVAVWSHPLMGSSVMEQASEAEHKQLGSIVLTSLTAQTSLDADLGDP